MGRFLSDREVAALAPAEQAAFHSPVPTQMISNGEFNPLPQNARQRQVESRIKEMADTNGRRLGLDRRQFLRTACGMATAFVAMNEVYGRVFDVGAAEAAQPDAAAARAAATSKQFIFDDQLHFVRDDYSYEGLLGLAQYAVENWNVGRDAPMSLDRYKFDNFLKEVYLDSDTTVGLLSGAPFDDPAKWFLSNDQIKQAADTVNSIAGGRRLLYHSLITPKQEGWMEEAERCIAVVKPTSWKGYTIGDPLNPTATKYPWRLDDEGLMYPFYEKAVKAGITTICIHKGLLPADYASSMPNAWQYATVDDVPKAAKDWPQISFVMYHAAMRMFLEDPQKELNEFEKTGNINWVTDLARIPEKYGVSNVYADLGTTFAASAIANPRFCAAVMGTLVKGLGHDHVFWGTDSVWYGSPQWQIEAFRRLEIPEDMQKRFGFAPLGPADGPVKSAILGLNGVQHYKIALRQADLSPWEQDGIGKVKHAYLQQGGPERSNAAYGYVVKAG
ncbi:MAG TPA: amidohydrolase family protein [Acetobacteraceae bacterium]|nr:amidohydrolase family protein [Acetobacteraceae bacterium]